MQVWFPVKNRKHITLFCPYCGQRIDFKVHRKEFDKLKCVNPKCEYKLKTGFRYTYRDYPIALDNIQQYIPKAKINLSASHFSTASIAMALFFFISSRYLLGKLLPYFLVSSGCLFLTNPSSIGLMLWRIASTLYWICYLSTYLIYGWLMKHIYFMKVNGDIFSLSLMENMAPSSHNYSLKHVRLPVLMLFWKKHQEGLI